MQIVTYVTFENLLMEPFPHIEGLFSKLWLSKATQSVYKYIKCNLVHVSFRQLELYCLAPFLKSYSENTKLNLFLIYQHAHWIERTKNKFNQQPVCNKTFYICDITAVYVT